jgi:peptide-methionine (S)-S-oxide reductase
VGTLHEVATLGGGCYWCLEAVFENVIGVSASASGFMGGHVPNATYRQVCEGTTGHAEVIKVTFDPSVVSFGDLLNVFFATHDPTTLNRQGADIGTQYRSVIFTHSDEQKAVAMAKIAEINAAKIFGSPIVTEVSPASAFISAEEYHQGYFRANPYQPYCLAVVAPKVAKFRKSFTHLMKG